MLKVSQKSRAKQPEIEDLEIELLSEKLANEIWDMVTTWEIFAKETLGKKLVRAADSICTNIAGVKGRLNFKDNRQCIRVARGSLCETVSLLKLAHSRRLVSSSRLDRLKPLLDELPSQLNDYLKAFN
ncbi:MAG: four helix bundle protein [Cyanobacteriota bacterium]|nr:four helix bundle protein [Cyanobacteriota bacterium]